MAKLQDVENPVSDNQDQKSVGSSIRSMEQASEYHQTIQQLSCKLHQGDLVISYSSGAIQTYLTGSSGIKSTIWPRLDCPSFYIIESGELVSLDKCIDVYDYSNYNNSVIGNLDHIWCVSIETGKRALMYINDVVLLDKFK
jgi:hypothetical protein